MGDVKDSVVAVQVWNQWVYGNVNEGWDESSVVHCMPTDWIKLSPYRLLIECCSADLEVGSCG